MIMTPEEFIEAYKEAFGADTQLPIAFGYSDEPLTEPKEGLRCLMGLFPKVRKGDTVTLADKFISCGGGMLYMGTGELQDRIPNFVSNIEHYQQTPQMVRDYVEGLHIVPAPKRYINFQRADKLNSWEDIEGLIFFAKPDVLSGLSAWAFFDDNSESAVITRFASGCASLITMAVAEISTLAKTCAGSITRYAQPSSRNAMRSCMRYWVRALRALAIDIIYNSIYTNCCLSIIKVVPLHHQNE